MPRFAIPDLLLVMILAVFVGVPLCATFFVGTGSTESVVEHRQLSALPKWPRSVARLKLLPSQFDAFARDRFGFREELLTGYKFILADVFGQSASDTVIVGRKGWLYTIEDDALADMRGADPFTPEEIDNTVKQIIARGDMLAALHIRYAFVVAPDKHSVYPNFLPHGVYGGFDRRRLHALDQAMAKAGRSYYLDLSDSMRIDVAGSPWPLYYKGDTHWNVWGAYLGYQTLAARFNSDGILQLRYRFGQFRQPGPANRRGDGDLVRMSGYAPIDPDIWPPGNMPCYPLHDWSVSALLRRRLNRSPPSPRQTGDCDGGAGTALVFHDSFMDNMAWHVSSNFAKTLYIWEYPDAADFATLVRYLHPDVVLVERVERLMHQFSPADVGALVAQLSLAGQPATVSEDGSLVIGLAGRSVSRSKVDAGIAIDKVSSHDGHWWIEGWADMGAAPAAAVIAVADGTIVAEAPMAEYRPDVVSSTGNSKLGWSGYALRLPVGFGESQLAALRLYVLDYDTYGSGPVGDRIQQLLEKAGVGLDAASQSAGHGK